MKEKKQKKIYREIAVADRAAVVVNGAAVVVNGAAVVVATGRIDRAVDLNLNLSLNFNDEGIFYYGLRQKSRYLEPFLRGWRGWTTAG